MGTKEMHYLVVKELRVGTGEIKMAMSFMRSVNTGEKCPKDLMC